MVDDDHGAIRQVANSLVIFFSWSNKSHAESIPYSDGRSHCEIKIVQVQDENTLESC